jgi:hypothetical protein
MQCQSQNCDIVNTRMFVYEAIDIESKGTKCLTAISSDASILDQLGKTYCTVTDHFYERIHTHIGEAEF